MDPELKPEIKEEGDNFHVIIPKIYTNKENLKVFIDNIVKSRKSNHTGSDLDSIIESLKKIWPEPEALVKKNWDDLKILVIDDQSTIRGIMRTSLHDLGFNKSNIEDASDGKPAIEKMKKQRFDLIISDWNMPEINGRDLLKVVKSVPGFKNVFFIMVTGRGDQKSVLEAIENGIDGYIIKPFTTAHVEKVLKKTIP